MGKPYSDDLRERVVAAIEAGHTRVKVAELYNMALSTVGGIIKRKRETGSVSPDKFGGDKNFRRCRPGCGWNLARRNLPGNGGIGSSCGVKWLFRGGFSKGLPSISLALVDLTGNEQ